MIKAYNENLSQNSDSYNYANVNLYNTFNTSMVNKKG